MLWIPHWVQGMATSARQVGDGDSWLCLHTCFLSFEFFPTFFHIFPKCFPRLCHFSSFPHHFPRVIPHFPKFSPSFHQVSPGFLMFSIFSQVSLVVFVQVGAWPITCCVASPVTPPWPATRQRLTRRGRGRCSCGARRGGGGDAPKGWLISTVFGGFLKLGDPQIIHCGRDFHYKPSARL